MRSRMSLFARGAFLPAPPNFAIADFRRPTTRVTRRRRRTYNDVANVGQRWRDLAGYYTRYGDVRELLSAVDDRYVIMNAGDELRLSFPAAEPPKAGWTRDFVLIGDGWVKDGDYNTTASKTVGPLPQHGHPDYAPAKTDDIEADPVYQAHAGDWRKYHTRFVEPRVFLSGLRCAGSERPATRRAPAVGGAGSVRPGGRRSSQMVQPSNKSAREAWPAASLRP